MRICFVVRGVIGGQVERYVPSLCYCNILFRHCVIVTFVQEQCVIVPRTKRRAAVGACAPNFTTTWQ
jgi:hypothetical protein